MVTEQRDNKDHAGTVPEFIALSDELARILQSSISENTEVIRLTEVLGLNDVLP